LGLLNRNLAQYELNQCFVETVKGYAILIQFELNQSFNNCKSLPHFELKWWFHGWLGWLGVY